MAKLISFFLVLIALQASMLIYAAPTSMTDHCGNVPLAANYVTSDTCEAAGGTWYAYSNSLWNFVTNLDNWNSLAFILGLVGIAAGIGLIGVTAASIFGFKTDFLIFAGAIGGFISLGGLVFINLGNMIKNELISKIFTDCTPGVLSCTPVVYILAVTLGPFALYYVWTVIEYWRGKDF
jgi:hypothetical protein